MGTFGAGPLDSDNALDVKGAIASASSEHARRGVLMDVLSGVLLPLDDEDTWVNMQKALGGCALIADVLRKEHFYTDPPEADGDFSIKTFKVSPAMLRLATKAVYKAWDRCEPDTEEGRELTQLLGRLLGRETS